MDDNFKKLHQINDSTAVIELHPQEVQLIRSLRNNWRFGEVTILVREGIPYRLMRVQEFIDLNKKET